jgi:hypothetical protein
MRILLLLLPIVASAQVCDPALFGGVYGLQLSGMTTISGNPQSATSLGRLVFDGHGNITGNSSTMFAGYLQGNPVKGTYELGTDCTLKWKLQDDSGVWQTFSGRLSSDLASGRIQQVGLGAPYGGTLVRAADQCSSQDLRKRYSYRVSGSVAAAGTVDIDRNGTFSIDADCTVTFDLLLSAGGERLRSLHMRGLLVNAGREILAIEIDPGAMTAAQFNATQ